MAEPVTARMHKCTNARRAFLHFCIRAVVHSCICAFLAAVPVARLHGQSRLSILQAEARRAPTAQDLAMLRAGVRSADGQTARVAVRALGRLERPALIVDI